METIFEFKENDTIYNKNSGQTYLLVFNEPYKAKISNKKKEILISRIRMGDFSYKEGYSSGTIWINIIFENKVRPTTYSILCEEIFPDIDTIDEENSEITIEELKKLVKTLKNKINLLKLKNEQLCFEKQELYSKNEQNYIY